MSNRVRKPQNGALRHCGALIITRFDSGAQQKKTPDDPASGLQLCVCGPPWLPLLLLLPPPLPPLPPLLPPPLPPPLPLLLLLLPPPLLPRPPP